MRYLALALLAALAACSTVEMRHPATGQVVKCGPYSKGANSAGDAMREAQCINDFKEQGYVRVAN